MEKIGFKVPEVAKNMSMQEAKLLDIADQLGRWVFPWIRHHMAQAMLRMLDHYHEVVGSVEGAELELLLEDLKATEVWEEISITGFTRTYLGGSSAWLYKADVELSGHFGLYHAERHMHLQDRERHQADPHHKVRFVIGEVMQNKDG